MLSIQYLRHIQLIVDVDHWVCQNIWFTKYAYAGYSIWQFCHGAQFLQNRPLCGGWLSRVIINNPQKSLWQNFAFKPRFSFCCLPDSEANNWGLWLICIDYLRHIQLNVDVDHWFIDIVKILSHWYWNIAHIWFELMNYWALNYELMSIELWTIEHRTCWTIELNLNSRMKWNELIELQ